MCMHCYNDAVVQLGLEENHWLISYSALTWFEHSSAAHYAEAMGTFESVRLGHPIKYPAIKYPDPTSRVYNNQQIYIVEALMELFEWTST